MKYLKRYLILGAFILLASSHWLIALNDAPMYNEAKTNELGQYLNSISMSTFPNMAERRHKIKKLIEEGASLKVASDTQLGSLAEYFEIDADLCDLITSISRQGLSIETKNNNGWNALHWAAHRQCTNAIALLIRLGANIEAQENRGCTPLHYTIFNGDKKHFDILVSLGANIEAKNNEGETTLSIADAFRKSEIFLHLLSLGANEGKLLPQDIQKEFQKRFGCNFSEDAKLQKEDSFYKMIRLKDNEGLKSTISSCESKKLKSLIRQINAHGSSPLDIAIIGRNVEAIPLLLSCGAAPFGGLYNGVFLASLIPEWKHSPANGQPSLYEQILAVPLRLTIWLRRKLPRDITVIIIRLVLPPLI